MKIKESVDTGRNSLARKIQTTYNAQIDKSSANIVMDMLAKLYYDPYAAVLREYVSNAHDANVEANADKPVEVHLPEDSAPYLSIKDHGNGLDYLGIVSVFANFGTSTKRNSNEFIGGFGIGSKSGLAMSDSIHVTSVCNGVLNEFVLERTNDGIVTRFTCENEPTTDDSGTTVTIDFAHDTIDHDVTEYITRKLNPERTLCGWSKNEVFVTNAEYKEYNECRVPDTWYFNGHEYKKPCYYENYSNFKGILVGKVFYGLPSEHELAKDAKYQESTSLIIPFGIKDIKVTYSREKIDLDDKASRDLIIQAVNNAKEHTKQEYLDIANDSTLQPYEKIRKLSDMGISTYHLSYKTIHMAPEIPKELDEPAVKLSIVSDFMQKEYSISASTNKVRVDSDLDIFLIFDTELPKRPALKKFINWVIFETGDTYKPIKEMLQTNLSYNAVATTKRGYAKMVYTNNKSIANVQAAYDEFEKTNVKTTDDLSDREITYYNRWENKYKTKMGTQWLSNHKCIIVHPNAKYRSTKTAIIELSKLRVPMPKVDYNDIEFITPKNKKEYDYLINLDPRTPTINADDIAELNSYLNHWKICPNRINVLKTAQIFRDICTDRDKYLHSNLWSKTPFANQNCIERKMCCLSQCYYFDGYSFENKDLVTKAYSKYAGYMSGHIERDEALEIIDHINNTCASEIATLNQMLSDLDPLIK